MKESDIQNDIMIMLGSHPNVSWAMVITTGKVKVCGRFMTIGKYMSSTQKRTTGMSDVVGMLKNGKFFGIEVKKPKEKPTTEQLEFIDLVKKDGGIAGWCNSVVGALEIINYDDKRLKHTEK